jgi:hypothetical protein
LFKYLYGERRLPDGNDNDPKHGVLCQMRENSGDQRPATGDAEKWTPICARSLSNMRDEDDAVPAKNLIM